MSPLDRKLFRDLTRIKGQAAAIGAVIGVGVLLLVMMHGLVNTLEETRRTYYDRYRLAEVFAPVVRAPDHLLTDLGQIDGVRAVEGRLTTSAQIDPGGGALPVRAQVVSLPDQGAPRLNNVLITAGQLPAPGRADAVLVLDSFANARGLAVGDWMTVTLSGVQRQLQISGTAQAPEFLYVTPPGEMMPDDTRAAVLWLRHDVLAAALDMGGAFNEALIALSRGAEVRDVMAQVDRLLDPFGGTGAYERADLPSDRFVSEEISGLKASATGVPPIFLAVAAFLLYIVISRIVQAEREEIGLLKAFGYTGAEVALHYLKMVLVIAGAGAIVGAMAGVYSGRGMSLIYMQFYKFPFLVFEVDPRSFITGFAVSIATAAMGSVFVLRRVFALTPAVAMRPPAPPDYSRSAAGARWLLRVLDQPSRMVLRRLTRYPWRMTGAVIGIAAGMALSVANMTVFTGFDRTIDQTFSVIDRSDATVAFAGTKGRAAAFELAHIDGVMDVEPVRFVPAILRNGRTTYRGTIDGLVATPRLNRVIGADGAPLEVRGDGLILGKGLADILNITPGQTLTVEVREGRRPTLEIPVTGIAETLMGAPAFMQLETLNHALNEPDRISAAYLKLDPALAAQAYRQIKDMPGVAGISLKSDTRAAFEKIMDSGAGGVRYVMVLIAGVISFGIVYNAARIAFAERVRDLASLRVMGFTKGEASFVLLGELGIVTLIALPLGGLLGQGLTYLIVLGFSTDLYQIPVTFSPNSHGAAALAVVMATVISGLLVKRDIDRIALTEALKTRE